jgi:hypothetical protein
VLGDGTDRPGGSGRSRRPGAGHYDWLNGLGWPTIPGVTRVAAPQEPSADSRRVREEIRELEQEVHRLRRGNERRSPAARHPVGRRSHLGARRPGPARLRPFQRRCLALLVGLAALLVALHGLGSGAPGAKSFQAPDHASLVGLNRGARIVAIADSQLGYRTAPSHSYCNKFSAYWRTGSGPCPTGETAEQWCADFAAWTWRTAGVRFSYGYGRAQINPGAVSFYLWGVAHGHWHRAGHDYVAAPGDVAVYGLVLGADPSAAHVAVVTDDPAGRPGPDVINGDGDHGGFSVVEAGRDQTRADVGHGHAMALAGYVSPS